MGRHYLGETEVYTDFGNVSVKDGIYRFGSQLSAAMDNANDKAIYFRGGNLYAWNGTSETNLLTDGSGGASSWDELYANDENLTIDAGTLTFSLTHATNDGLTLTGAGGSAGSVLQITNAGSGNDINGTSDTWSVSKAGLATVVGLTTTGDITSTGAAIDWDLKDNDANALSIDSTDQAGIIAIDTTNDAETITMDAILTVAGVLTASTGFAVSDGATTLTDNSNAASGFSFTNDTVTTYGNASDAGPFVLTSATITTGYLLHLSTDESAMNGGGFLRCWQQDGGAAVFTVGEAGLTTIAGAAAGTDALVVTVGDILVGDSDASVFESENGTTTLLTLDNKAGVIGSDAAVLLLDAGGAVASGGNILRVAPTGTPNAGAIGIEFVGAGKALNAVYIDADPTGADVMTINGGGALTSDNAVLTVSSDGALASGGNTFRVDTTGTPASGAIYAEFDFAGITDTNENVGVMIDAGGKKVVGLHVDADPAAGDVAYMHTDAALANNKAVLSLHDAGTPANTGSNLLRLEFAGTDTNKHTLVEIIGAGKDCEALNIDADPTTKDVMYIHTDGVTADNKAVLSLHSAGAAAAGSSILRLAHAGTPAAATSYTFEIDNSGATSTNNAVCMRVNNDDSTGAVFQATSGGAAAPLLDLYSTDTGATGVVIKTTHTSTGSAADSDIVLSLQAWGLDDGDAGEEYGRIESTILDASAGTEASSMSFYVTVGGTSETSLVLKTDTAVVGAGSAAANVTSSGTYDLVLDTNEGTNSGTITITDAANGNISLAPNGTGLVNLTAPTWGQVTAKTTTATLTVAEGGLISATSVGGAYSLTLPAASGNAGLFYTLKKTDAAANAITLDGNGAETIDGAATYAAVDAEFDTVTIVCDGSNWHIVSVNLA